MNQYFNGARMHRPAERASSHYNGRVSADVFAAAIVGNQHQKKQRSIRRTATGMDNKKRIMHANHLLIAREPRRVAGHSMLNGLGVLLDGAPVNGGTRRGEVYYIYYAHYMNGTTMTHVCFNFQRYAATHRAIRWKVVEV